MWLRVAGLVPHFLGLPVHVKGDYTYKWKWDFWYSRPEVDCLDVLMALFTCIESIDSLVVAKIGKVTLVLATTIWALQPLEKPFGITTGAHKPPCPDFAIQKSKVRLAAANRD